MFARLLLLAAATAGALPAQADIAGRIDEIFKVWDRAGSPGAAVAVIRDGTVVFQKGYGTANLEYDIPIKPETVFHVASVSKQFTAMAIVLLEQDKKLSIEDDVRKYLPELPDYGHKITIRNLLQHTSGIRDQWQTLGLAGWRLDDVITQKQILRMMFRQKELNFEPGTQHMYSNAGFTLLAEIVERASGKPLAAFCDERIFQPLGMSRTHFHDDHRRIVRDRAYSYETAIGGFRASPLNYANAGATSLFTTAPDLVKWLDNFRDAKVGGTAAIARLQERAILADRKQINYALGVALDRIRGLRAISHGGADAGYRSYVAWFPDQKLGVAVVSNLASFNSSWIASRVSAVFLESQTSADNAPARAPDRAPEPAREPFDTKDLANYPGTYWSDELETQYTFLLKDGRLTAEHAHHGEIPLFPTAKDQFRTASWFMQSVRFQRDASGGVTAVTLGGGRVSGVKFVRR